LEQNVRNRTARLQETIAELEHFSYTITHDMRAPLRAMRGLGGLLLEECSECLHPTRREYIRRIAEAAPGVARVEKCLVRKVGFDCFVDMHVEVDPQMTVQRSHEIAHDVKNKIRGQIPAVRDVLVHIEPARKAK